MTNDGSTTTTTPPTISPPSLSNETLRERILTGSGTGAARGSLTKVGSKYTNFLTSLLTTTTTCHDNDNSNDNASSSTAAAAAAALETELSLHDIEIRKLLLSSKASDYNSSQYTTTLTNMQHTLSSIQSDITTFTTQLDTERQIKRHRQEYNALAKIANDKLPPLYETQIELANVQNEIGSVQEQVKLACYELQVREKQMRVFMTSLNDLKSTLNEEELKKKKKKNDDDNNNNDIEGANDDDGNHEGGGLREVKGTKRKRSDGGDDGGGSMTDNSNNDIGAL